MTGSHRPTRRGVWLAATLLLASPALLEAQYQRAPAVAAYALENVTLIHADGRQEAGVNVVVRRGLIQALGPGVEIPVDAKVLEGDSLFIYPGIVDAFGDAPFEYPDDGVNRQEMVSWDPPRSVQGFTPHLRVAEHLTADGNDGRDLRTMGVVAAGVHPTQGLAPGQGAAVLFRKTVKRPWDLVVNESLGLLFSFKGSPGGYPRTLFAVMAFMRQAFEDASHHGVVEAEFARDPSGLKVPAWDPDYEALREAASGRTPVFFMADESEDIRRAIGLADELGFRMILVGGGEAWKVTDLLLERGIPVLVSVDFPEPQEWEPTEESENVVLEEPGGAEGQAEAGEHEVLQEDVELELEPAAARERARLNALYANAAKLVEAGVSISLTSGGGGGDILEGARKAMEYGLSEQDALKAVTTTPATLLGLPSVSRVERGLAATFIVTDGGLFDDDTRIAYTFVEGELEEGVTSAGNGEPPLVDITGEWSVEISAEGMTIPLQMTVNQEGASFSGTMSSGEMGSSEVKNGVVSGNSLTFETVIPMMAQSINFTATVQGDRIRGSGSGGEEIGSFTFTATRRPGQGEGGAR